nr:uncharacterized protein LOC109191771 isoform X1 [Ipomoea trifida]
MAMGRGSWVCTLFTQVALCFALYVVLNTGQFQRSLYGDNDSADPYFISVSGGFRPLQEQIHLLKQMEMVAKKNRAKFVINISELGEGDPLMQNATQYYQSLEIPWYTLQALKGQSGNYYLKHIEVTHGRTLDLIAIDTTLYQDVSSSKKEEQLKWLINILEDSQSYWHIVVGFHPLVACGEDVKDRKIEKSFEPLIRIFLKYGVNAYLSRKACNNSVHKGDLDDSSNVSPVYGPDMISANQEFLYSMEITNGFLLHKVTDLEIVTYFVTSEGDFVRKVALQPRGKANM